MMRVVTVAWKAAPLAAFAALAATGPVSAHGKPRNPGPIVIEKQGSFFVNEENRLTSFPGLGGPGHLSVNGMYVEYQIPQNKKFPYPIVMIHGASHTGKTWDETPDGREGWKTYFLRKGFSVYLVDHVGRARSGFDPTNNNQARSEANPSLLTNFGKFTNEGAWTAFRIGPTSSPYTPYPDTVFPVDAYDEYVAQMVPNTETAVDPGCQTGGQNCTQTINALSALLDKIGPAIIMGHSQGGTMVFSMAPERPDLIKAIVGIDPASSCIIAEADLNLFQKIRVLSLISPHRNMAGRIARVNGCADSADRVRSVGGKADSFHLPDAGFVGNSHMFMMEQNSNQIADFIIKWLYKNVKTKHGHDDDDDDHGHHH